MQVATAIDTVLDRTIALGYGDVGLHVRRHPPGSLAERLSAEEEQLDVLVNNAGTMPISGSDRRMATS